MWKDSKVCQSDDTLPDGFDVREGDLVVYVPYSMGRMKHLWGEDAEVFRPERWLDEKGVFQPESPFKFAAFQAGPRVCLGKDFAYRQMKIFAAVLLRFFSFEFSDAGKEVTYRCAITLQVDEGLQVKAFHRASRP